MSTKEPMPTPITSAQAPDLEVVGRTISTMIKEGAISAMIAAILSLLRRMRDLNSELMAKLAQKSRARPPSERLHRLQLELPFLAESPAPANDGAPPPPQQKRRGPKNARPHGRPKLPDHLTRIPKVLPVAAAQRICPVCQIEVATVGYKTTEILDIEPAQYVVRQEMRETCACQSCNAYVRTAEKGDQVVDRGILGDELLVQALVDHYDEAVPWERMERRARAQGVPLSANTVASSVGRLIDLFAPVVEHISKACFASSFTALDATSMPVIDVEHALGIRTSALWLIEGDHLYSLFVYAPTGHAKHLDELLAGHTLKSVMCDASATNNSVDRAGGKRGGCNSHGRRGLAEALRLGDKRALEGLEIYGAIFHVDAESKRLGENARQRFERRQRDSAPYVEKLRLWVERMHLEVEPKARLGRAVGYLRRQWRRLTAFLQDPLMELTNNEVERGLRRWVLARKTWLFVGHELSARRAADALSLLGTCRKMGVEPRRYLREALAKILAGEKNLNALLPESYVSAAIAPTASVAA